MDFEIWENYFLKNKDHFSEIDWQAEDQLTKDEKKKITSSIQQFQKGENSEGKRRCYPFADRN